MLVDLILILVEFVEVELLTTRCLSILIEPFEIQLLRDGLNVEERVLGVQLFTALVEQFRV